MDFPIEFVPMPAHNWMCRLLYAAEKSQWELETVSGSTLYLKLC